MVICIFMISAGGVEAASDISDVRAVENLVERPVRDAVSVRQDTQKNREKWLEEQKRMLSELDQLESENRRLASRREMLVSQVSGARERIAAKEKELQGIRRISEDIRPFLEETLSWLETETGEGLPFLSEERRKRVDRLRVLMDDPDVSVSEKFRKIMEAMLIEAEYGITAEVTGESIEFSGEPVQVNVLRLGRTSLFYQTLDGSTSGFFNAGEGRWEALSKDYNRNIKMAMDMALKRRPVELVNLPVGRVVVK